MNFGCIQSRLAATQYLYIFKLLLPRLESRFEVGNKVTKIVKAVKISCNGDQEYLGRREFPLIGIPDVHLSLQGGNTNLTEHWGHSIVDHRSDNMLLLRYCHPSPIELSPLSVFIRSYHYTEH
jgi:hypothetical protein